MRNELARRDERGVLSNWEVLRSELEADKKCGTAEMGTIRRPKAEVRRLKVGVPRSEHFSLETSSDSDDSTFTIQHSQCRLTRRAFLASLARLA
jgi:hypothetical protein